MDVVNIVNPHPAVMIIVSIYFSHQQKSCSGEVGSPPLLPFFFFFLNDVVQMLTGWRAPGFSERPLSKEEAFNPWANSQLCLLLQCSFQQGMWDGASCGCGISRDSGKCQLGVCLR